MNNSKYSLIFIVILFLSLVLLFTGISISIFSYLGEGTTANSIQTGRVVFSYSDANGGSNGILIENAFPISDDIGKVLSGEEEYFDFTVTAFTTKTNLSYEISVNKDESSTLSDDWIKVYLTSFEGSDEVASPITLISDNVTTYSELQDTKNRALKGKTIYYGTVEAGEVSYGKKFRLRMWVKDPNETNFDYSTLNNKYFSVRVGVAAFGIN